MLPLKDLDSSAKTGFASYSPLKLGCLLSGFSGLGLVLAGLTPTGAAAVTGGRETGLLNSGRMVR